MQVSEDSSQITLHSRELQILAASVTPLMKNATLDALPSPQGQLRNYLHSFHNDQKKNILLEPKRSIVRVFAKLRAGERCRLHLLFKGHLSNTLTGFYKSSYRDSHNKTR
jgi:hypothetical protein